MRTKKIGKGVKIRSVKKLVADLDRVFSIYVRQRDSDDRGYATCFTCGVKKPWQELQAGHYISRMHKNVRFDEQNVFPQCTACNIFKHGAMDDYALALQRAYGPTILQELSFKKRVSKQFTANELLELIAYYRAKVV